MFFYAQIPALADVPSPVTQDDALIPIQIKGDTVEYFHEEQKAVGTGNVTIDYNGTHLAADKITVYTQSKQAIAEGNVVLKQEGNTFTGSRAEYNYETNVGYVDGMSAEFAPTYYGKAKTVQRFGPDHIRATDAYITTCCGEDLFYKIQAQQVDIYPGDKLVARNAVLYVKGIPVLFVPFYVQKFVDFQRAPIQMLPGKNSDWGAFLLTKWRYYLVDNETTQIKGNTLLDYREKRGVAGGNDLHYKDDRWGRGAARFYYADDQGALDPGIDAERYRAQWRHQMRLTKDTTFTAELNKHSDEDVIKDFFFREEYERDAFPDNYVSIITAKPEYTLSFLDRERLNDFTTVVERSPEIRFDTHNRQFLDTPLYLRQEVQFSNLRKEFAHSEDDLAATRLDTNHTATYAGKVGIINVAPHIGTRQTYYSRGTADTERDFVRGGVDMGVDFSTRFYKTYNGTVNMFGLDFNQFRHIFTPTASYLFRPNLTYQREYLQEFDLIDTLDKQNLFRFNFENKILTKYHVGEDGRLESRDLARIIPTFDLNYDTHRIENVGIDVELKPYTWMSIESDAAFDTVTRDFTAANFDFWIVRDKYKFAIGQRYLQENSSQTTAQLEWRMREDVYLKVYERFEFTEGVSKEFEIALSKTFNCTIMDFVYNHRPDEDSFFVILRLKAFPVASFSFSQTYSTPKSGYTGSRRSSLKGI